MGGRRNTVEEVLDELDTVLFEASIPFDELKKKVERFNLTFKPYAPEITVEELPEIPYSTDAKRTPRLNLRPTKQENQRIQDEKYRNETEAMYKKVRYSSDQPSGSVFRRSKRSNSPKSTSRPNTSKINTRRKAFRTGSGTFLPRRSRRRLSEESNTMHGCEFSRSVPQISRIFSWSLSDSNRKTRGLRRS